MIEFKEKIFQNIEMILKYDVIGNPDNNNPILNVI